MDSRFRRHLLKASLAALTMLAVHGRSLAADLLIAMPNWPSGQAAANIIKYGIKEKLNLDADVREMGSMTAFAGMDTGEVDVYPEVWLPNLDSLVKKYVDGRKTVGLSPKGVSATQGSCVTRETADKYGVRDISDLADPKKAAVFDTDGDGKGEMWIGALGGVDSAKILPISSSKIDSKTYQVELDAGGKKTSCLVDTDGAVKSVEPI